MISIVSTLTEVSDRDKKISKLRNRHFSEVITDFILFFYLIMFLKFCIYILSLPYGAFQVLVLLELLLECWVCVLVHIMWMKNRLCINLKVSYFKVLLYLNTPLPKCFSLFFLFSAQTERSKVSTQRGKLHFCLSQARSPWGKSMSYYSHFAAPGRFKSFDPVNSSLLKVAREEEFSTCFKLICVAA